MNARLGPATSSKMSERKRFRRRQKPRDSMFFYFPFVSIEIRFFALVLFFFFIITCPSVRVSRTHRTRSSAVGSPLITRAIIKRAITLYGPTGGEGGGGGGVDRRRGREGTTLIFTRGRHAVASGRARGQADVRGVFLLFIYFFFSSHPLFLNKLEAAAAAAFAVGRRGRFYFHNNNVIIHVYKLLS